MTRKQFNSACGLVIITSEIAILGGLFLAFGWRGVGCGIAVTFGMLMFAAVVADYEHFRD